MRRRLTLGLFALALSATALTGARRAEAQPVCPLCQVGHHCCFIGGSPYCLPNSIPCP